jgi:U3 small nucleolar RNA-associated protein 7
MASDDEGYSSSSSRDGSDSEPENVDAIVRSAATRLGQKRKPAAAQDKPSTTKNVKNLDKYTRRAPISQKKIKGIHDKKLRGRLERSGSKFQDAAISAAKSEILLPSQAGLLEAEGLEKTYKFTQAQLAANVDQNTARKIFSLDLPDYGAYTVRYTRNGRNLLLGGQKGHLATMDMLRMRLSCEFQANDLVRDVSYLHNNSMFAAAQKKFVYIYDSSGAEAHCLRSIPEPRKMEFLPYHFLLATISGNGFLSYHDVTTGNEVAGHRTKLGVCDAMAQNPWNAVINLGHANGLVTLWTPNMHEAVVKMQCHQGPSTF